MATKTLNVRMQQIQLPDPDWQNKVLLSGEFGHNFSDGAWKVGDGVKSFPALKSLAFISPGTIIMTGNYSGPLGFARCDGRAADRSLYADLFKEIGTTYGAGNGSTTFNLPNFSARFPRGIMSASSDTPNISGGMAQVPITIDQMPYHRHGFMLNINHNDGVAVNEEALACALQYPGWRRYNGNTDYIGGGKAHENLPPYTGIYFHIKY